MDSDCKANTDREIYRVTPGDYYADSIFVTEDGYIGINCGGFVAVLPLKTWHSLASGMRPEEAKLRALLEGLKAENIDQCMQEPPERLRVLGAILSEAADEAVEVLSGQPLTNRQKRAVAAVSIVLDNPSEESAMRMALQLVREAFNEQA